MLIQPLPKNWKMKICGCGENTLTEELPAKVPGSVYSALLENGKMEDPYYQANELQALEIMKNDFKYWTEFVVEEEMLHEEKIILRFEGIDTLADIYLNSVWLGYADNMHRTWNYEVQEYIKCGENLLEVHFYSPTEFIRKAHEKKEINGTPDAMRGFPQIRKAHCMFGWDWGPRLPDAGIWRNVQLIGFHAARLDSVYIRQKHETNLVWLDLEIELEELITEKYDYRVSLESPNGVETVFENQLKNICVDNPQLWWPNGLGRQPLYQITVELLLRDEILDIWTNRIGLRDMKMDIKKDEYGESFCHRINGVNFFAMGADYIPEDNILSRINPDRTYSLLEQCKAANYNVIRVWGGGHYPSDDFFDACDELGLIVWEDFMFACAVYELTDEFEDNIRAEFIDNIKRIRHHASLGLWCGNNEMEMFVESNEYTTDGRLKSDYIKMYEYILPKLIKEYDPETFYWPASPSSGGGLDEPNAQDRGDVHYWDVWHGDKPITEYRKFYFRYVSEFGFQSFPTLKTIETFTEPKDRNIFSYVMEKHQRNQSANGKIMNYLGQTFLYPSDFGTLLYASQLLQAEAMRYGVEHFRRNRGRCMGTVIWQLNDCWPVASWSSIDYHGRWKALHYYEKRFFAPILLSCQEEGILTQDTNVNAQPYTVKKSIRLNVSNESRKERRVIVSWARRNAGGGILEEKSYPVTVPPMSAVWLEKVDMAHAALYEEYVSYQLEEDGTSVSSGTVLFCAPKHFKFENPDLEVSAEDGYICVKADAYARSVEILNENEDLILEDNYFDMNGGRRRVKVLKGEAKGLKARSVYDIG